MDIAAPYREHVLKDRELPTRDGQMTESEAPTRAHPLRDKEAPTIEKSTSENAAPRRADPTAATAVAIRSKVRSANEVAKHAASHKEKVAAAEAPTTDTADARRAKLLSATPDER